MTAKNIPHELKTYEQWIVWKKDKIPINPSTGEPAKTDNPNTWTTYREAIRYYLEHLSTIGGIGFVFSEDDPYTGLDLDDCLKGGIVEKQAQEIVERFNSYTEISTSETGLHILIQAKKKGERCSKGITEIYDSMRYFVMTGELLEEGKFDEILERQDELDKFYTELFGTERKKKKKKQGKRKQRTAPKKASLYKLSREQQKIYQEAINSRSVKKTLDERDPTDQSESDWAFIRALISEGIRDKEILSYAIQENPLSKWNREGGGWWYREGLIENALEERRGYYYTLKEARRKLQEDFKDKIDLDNHGKFVINAPISTGKTYNSVLKVKEALQQGINSLILVPIHSLADEWMDSLREILPEDTKIVHLYGATHDEVECNHQKQAINLLSKGHSKLFKRRFCQRCEQKNNCLHLQSLNEAKDANVLIATHAHGSVHQKFFTMKILNNHHRDLIIFDEMAEFIQETTLKLSDLKDNLKLLKRIDDGRPEYLFLTELIEDLLQAIDDRKDYLPQEENLGINQRQANKIDNSISDYYSGKKKVYPNLLWQLVSIINSKSKIRYRQEDDREFLSYTWRPEGSIRESVTTLFLSATLQKDYLTNQLMIPKENIQSIGEDIEVARDNLKIVQLPNVTGGRTRLLLDKGLQKRIKKTFRLILRKHKDKKIAVLAPLGKNLGDYVERKLDLDNSTTANTAKKEIIKMLNISNDRNLIDVSTRDLQKGKLPDGLDEIPVVHYGVIGINSLKGYEVIIEVASLFYHEQSIKEAIRKKYDMDLSEKSVKKTVPFYTQDGEEEVRKYVYENELIQLEIKHGEKADVQQAEGRFLREDKRKKIIYRLHGTNIKPYPSKIYWSWKTFFKYEFLSVMTAEELEDHLSSKQLQLWIWIRDNLEIGGEFSPNQIRERLKMKASNVSRNLRNLSELGLVSHSQKATGRNQKSLWKRMK